MAAQFSGPSSVTGITATVQVILLAIEQWQSSHPPIDRIVLFYNQYLSGTSCRPQKLRLLPLDLDWLSRLGQQPWLSESGALPFFTLDWERLFSALIRQYLFVSLYRAFAESLASENASRLTSMQTAEKNIEERLGELNTQYRHLRQSSITAEILDIVAGFEALTSCVIKQ
jgi:F-type H+-transporting ATPase subunit gamma